MSALLNNVPLPPAPRGVASRCRRCWLVAVLATAALLAIGNLV